MTPEDDCHKVHVFEDPELLVAQASNKQDLMLPLLDVDMLLSPGKPTPVAKGMPSIDSLRLTLLECIH